jgi:hypothetical protein
MATGKELVRTVNCNIWKEFIKNRKDFVSYQIFDSKGKMICDEKVKNKTFCHLKVLFNTHNLDNSNKDTYNLIAMILKLLTSNSNETMCVEVHYYYGFNEIIVS